MNIDEWNTFACYKGIQYRLLEKLVYNEDISFDDFIESGVINHEISLLSEMYGEREGLRQVTSVFKSVKLTGHI